MRHVDALKIAESLVEKLRPACERIEIKGSISRLKPDVKDIDILAIPDVTPLPPPRAQFGQAVPIVHKTRLDKVLFEICQEGFMKPAQKNEGQRLKKFDVSLAGYINSIRFELSLVLPPAQWGVLSVIRTGPHDFSQWMVTKKIHGGALPDTYYVEGGSVWDSETVTKFETPEEIDYFKLCGLNWIEPSKRVARWKL